jgi:hypothetical protein
VQVPRTIGAAWRKMVTGGNDSPADCTRRGAGARPVPLRVGPGGTGPFRAGLGPGRKGSGLGPGRNLEHYDTTRIRHDSFAEQLQNPAAGHRVVR